jgi:hypothetical protein
VNTRASERVVRYSKQLAQPAVMIRRADAEQGVGRPVA